MDGISFKQKINIVNHNTFYKLMETGGRKIEFGLSAPLFVKGKRFNTIGIKTCSGGGLTDGKEDSVGFHLLDCWDHYDRIDWICKNIFYSIGNPVSGLLIGGKDISRCPYSRPIFSKITEFFTDKIENLSIFDEHIGAFGLGSTSFIHDTETDTWTLLSMYGGHPVENLNDLKKCYKNVTIADGDVLQINGTEIPKEEIKKVFPKTDLYKMKNVN